ncbi:MAG: bifunctional phosphoribosylaminoimidazolecarboxamide formyltransferase/IMP cyclohydrolase [Propionibacteriaceae bacterium]|jgi:phosphoribosylaminoimidazolecarboxamide formyltransferase/IMP cyclohydrolase|nr:bifunctional phosphoribosylaminoimidazolecarboxamide formyltransferase/IMP cyclohydrolase [Propionibacteriaceae bacterium]
MSELLPIRRALISVYDKTDLIDLAQALVDAGVELVSTGSTAAKLTEAGLPVTRVEDVTGFPECFDGRVKTLHPRIHGGLLADRRLESHRNQLDELEIKPFDLLVSNLYPFTATVASGASEAEAIEQIDIGGPAMVRASAKNHPSVAVITSVSQYGQLKEALKAGGFTLEQRQMLALEAFRETAAYDIAVANWMATRFDGEHFPGWYAASFRRENTLRYGENSHQGAALYSQEKSAFAPSLLSLPDGELAGIAGAQQLGGKEMSYNNYVDGEAAYRACYDFDQPACAIIKHANPCGIAVGSDIATAHRLAHECDPVSAYGGVISVNRPVTLELAQQVKPIFTEVIIAPEYEPEALELLQTKKNLRILVAPAYLKGQAQLRQITGGVLLQDADLVDAEGDNPANWKLAAGSAVSAEELEDLAFAWKACRSVKSNAILLAKGGASVGVGMGQVNRVDSCRLAVERAGERSVGSLAASDAFFPFSDGPQILIDGGVKAIVEPGGSIRDQETIDLCEAKGVALYFTGTRHFFH